MEKAAECGRRRSQSSTADLNSIYTESVLKNSLTAEHSTQYLLNELRNCDLEISFFEELHKKSSTLGLDFLATPFDLKSVEFLKGLDLPAFKIGSPDFTNLKLIDSLASLDKLLILSTGMSTEAEIDQVINHLNSLEIQYALLHCNSTYPASFEDLNLNFIKRLELMCKRTVGYSGHEKGVYSYIDCRCVGSKNY